MDSTYVFEIVSLKDIVLQLEAEQSHTALVKVITEFYYPYSIQITLEMVLQKAPNN